VEVVVAEQETVTLVTLLDPTDPEPELTEQVSPLGCVWTVTE
jgi:hypothetical protein